MSKAERSVWNGMKKRCLDPANDSYKYYGGRGIKICSRWLKSFDDFYSDMGPRPSEKHSIDRINNNGNYEPGNCRWALPFDQNNNKSDNRIIEHDGKRLTAGQWERELGLWDGEVHYRLSLGWSEFKSLSIPSRPKESLGEIKERAKRFKRSRKGQNADVIAKSIESLWRREAARNRYNFK